MRSSPRTVLAAAILTYIGAGVLLLAGPMFLLGARDGTFFGRPTDTVGIAGAIIPIGAAPAAGAVLTLVGVALVWLAVLAQRRHPAGAVGLTVIGGLALVGLIYAGVAGDLVSALAPMAWILLALALLWIGVRSLSRRAAQQHPPPAPPPNS
jgi:hypothetical protein